MVPYAESDSGFKQFVQSEPWHCRIVICSSGKLVLPGEWAGYGEVFTFCNYHLCTGIIREVGEQERCVNDPLGKPNALQTFFPSSAPTATSIVISCSLPDYNVLMKHLVYLGETEGTWSLNSHLVLIVLRLICIFLESIESRLQRRDLYVCINICYNPIA